MSKNSFLFKLWKLLSFVSTIFSLYQIIEVFLG